MNVEVRDAVEADAETLGVLVDLPADALRNVVHDRTVRLAVERPSDRSARVDDAGEDGTDADEAGDGAGDASETEDGAGDAGNDASETGSDARGADGETDAESVRGFVAFDVREGTVHVTQLAGDAEAAERLLEEPIRFAENEGFDVAFVVPHTDTAATEAAEAVGFEAVEPGPNFEGEPTTRYRFRHED